MTPEERAAARGRARKRAEDMGFRRPDQAPDAPAMAVQLPTHKPRALRALLDRGHLTPEQAQAARQLFADAARYAREEPTA